MADQKKSKKAGRSSKSCMAYKSSGRREINKAKRALRVLARNPNDKGAQSVLSGLHENIPTSIVQRAKKELNESKKLVLK